MKLNGVLVVLLIISVLTISHSEPTSQIIVENNLSHFPNMQALKDFLKEDRTSELQGNDTFTCRDFALTVSLNAWKRGYYVAVYIKELNGTPHATCLAYLVEEDLWVRFEPQTDRIVAYLNQQKLD